MREGSVRTEPADAELPKYIRTKVAGGHELPLYAAHLRVAPAAVRCVRREHRRQLSPRPEQSENATHDRTQQASKSATAPPTRFASASFIINVNVVMSINIIIMIIIMIIVIMIIIISNSANSSSCCGGGGGGSRSCCCCCCCMIVIMIMIT